MQDEAVVGLNQDRGEMIACVPELDVAYSPYLAHCSCLLCTDLSLGVARDLLSWQILRTVL